MAGATVDESRRVVLDAITMTKEEMLQAIDDAATDCLKRMFGVLQMGIVEGMATADARQHFVNGLWDLSKSVGIARAIVEKEFGGE
jgi:hypothetical protein